MPRKQLGAGGISSIKGTKKFTNKKATGFIQPGIMPNAPTMSVKPIGSKPNSPKIMKNGLARASGKSLAIINKITKSINKIDRKFNNL